MICHWKLKLNLHKKATGPRLLGEREPTTISPFDSTKYTDVLLRPDDGTTGETEALTVALSDFSLHSDMAANRTTSLPEIEKKRINDAMSRAVSQNDVPHSIPTAVKASVALATCQATNGKMASDDRADSLFKDLAEYLYLRI